MLALAAWWSRWWTFGRAPGVARAGDGIKGGAGMTVRVAGAAGQRNARGRGDRAAGAGERVRIGYQRGGHRYLLSLSIDERGVVTPLYPEQGASLLSRPARAPPTTCPTAWS